MSFSQITVKQITRKTAAFFKSEKTKLFFRNVFVPTFILCALQSAAYAVDIGLGPNGQLSPIELKADTATLYENVGKFISMVRWGCLAGGIACFCLAGLNYMKSDNHQGGISTLTKAGFGLFVIVVGITFVNFMLGGFKLN